jgi:RecB family endonuclease NucS
VTDEAQVRQRAFELAAEGLPKEEVAQRLREELGVEIQPGTISAWKAHQTMGTYVEEVEGARDLKFGLERDMQVALRENIGQLDPSLRIVDGGTERHVATGRIDILAEDREGSLVVIELKADEARDSALTQVLGYIGALKEEEGRDDVRGILVARGFSSRVLYAARTAGVNLVRYGYSFTFTAVT